MYSSSKRYRSLPIKQSHSRKGLGRVESKGTRKKNPVWDDTVNDLSAHKLSKQELERRHQAIVSRNAEEARHELYEIAKPKGVQKQGINFSGNLRPSPHTTSGHATSKLSALHSAIHGRQLHDVLVQSDKALDVVKDLFGDDPKRFSAVPNITIAPNILNNKKALERTIGESLEGGPTPTAEASPGGVRDESIVEMVLKKPALNDIPSPPIEDDEVDESDVCSNGYQSSIDLNRFQRFIREQERLPKAKAVAASEAPLPPPSAAREQEAAALERHIREEDVNSELSSIRGVSQDREGTVDSEAEPVITGPHQKEEDLVLEGEVPLQHPLQISHKPRPPLEADESRPLQVKPAPHTPSRRKKNSRGIGIASQQKHLSELEILHQMVRNLEQELQEYEDLTGQSSGKGYQQKSPSLTFSGLTASLLASVTKLAHYLKLSESQLREEVAVREQLVHTMSVQQNLMDALTKDVVQLQEQNASFQTQLKNLQETSKEELIKQRDKIMCEVNDRLSAVAASAHFTPVPPQAHPWMHTPAPVHVEEGSPVHLSNFNQPPTVVSSSPQPLPTNTLTHTSAKPSSTSPAAVSQTVSSTSARTTAALQHACSPADTTVIAKPVIIPRVSPLVETSFLQVSKPQFSEAPGSSGDWVSKAVPVPRGVIYAQSSPLSYPDSLGELQSHTTADGAEKRVHFSETPSVLEITPRHKPRTAYSAGAKYFSTELPTSHMYAPPPPPISVALQIPMFESVAESTKQLPLFVSRGPSAADSGHVHCVASEPFLSESQDKSLKTFQKTQSLSLSAPDLSVSGLSVVSESTHSDTSLAMGAGKVSA